MTAPPERASGATAAADDNVEEIRARLRAELAAFMARRRKAIATHDNGRRRDGARRQKERP